MNVLILSLLLGWLAYVGISKEPSPNLVLAWLTVIVGCIIYQETPTLGVIPMTLFGVVIFTVLDLE